MTVAEARPPATEGDPDRSPDRPPSGATHSVEPPGRVRRRVLLALLPLLLVGAASVRGARLDEPNRLYFDEKHYVPHARQYLEQGVEDERPAHPPVGKWLIAGGISVFGDRPLGWRLPSLLAGTGTVALTYLLGRRLTRARAPALLAALLVAVDGFSFTMSRIAMLDVFVGFFVCAGAWLLLVDADRRAAGGRGGSARWLGGIALGLAVGTKWAAVPVIAVALVAVVLADRRRRRSSIPIDVPAPPTPPVLARLRRALGPVLVPLALVPVAVYVLSYAGWVAGYRDSETGRERCADPPCSTSPTELAAGWWFEQYDMFDVQRRLEPTHGYRSSPLGWPVLLRPVLYYAERCPPGGERAEGVLAGEEGCEVSLGRRARVVALGNPALWWPAVAVVPVLAWATLRRRLRAAAVPLVLVLAQYLPWFASWKPGFAFYLTPVAPFAALGVAVVVTGALRGRRRRWPPLVLAAVAVGLFVFFYPLWSAVETTSGAEDLRLWFDSWR